MNMDSRLNPFTRQLHSQRTDSLQLLQGHRMGIVQFILEVVKIT